MGSTRGFGEVVPGATYVDRPGGYAVVTNEAGEVAVVSTPKGLFLTGGAQEDTETPEQAAVREAYEECGLQIHLKGRLGAADEFVFAEDEGIYYRKRCAFFGALVFSQEDHAEADHELVWMTPEEAAKRLRHESQRWAVREACRLGAIQAMSANSRLDRHADASD